MYGGHITDDWDRRLCRTYLEEFIKPEMLAGELSLAPGFPLPGNMDYHGYHQVGLRLCSRDRDPAPSTLPAGLGLLVQGREAGLGSLRTSSMAPSLFSWRVLGFLAPNSW